MRSSRTLALTVVAVAVAMAAGTAVADDRDLLRSFTPRPNVLMVVDSSGSMSNDLTDCHGAIAAGDDPHSKMFEVKTAVKFFVHSQPNFNLGFTFYERSKPEFGPKLFLYRLLPDGADLDFSWRYYIAPGGTLTDNDDGASKRLQLSAGALMRFGNPEPAFSGDAYVNTFPGPFFGSLGKHSVADWSTSANSQRVYFNGVRYTGEYRVDAWLLEPIAGTGYYYPAHAWNLDVQKALIDFQRIHADHFENVFDPEVSPSDKLAALDALHAGRQVLQDVLDANQIGAQQLTMRVLLRQCSGSGANIRDSTGVCQSGSWVEKGSVNYTLLSAGGLPPSAINPADTAPGAYPPAFLVNEYADCGYNGKASDMYAVSDCGGWQGSTPSTVKIPLVPIPTDEDPSLLPLVDLLLRPMGEMQFFFPTRSGNNYWPVLWDPAPQCKNNVAADPYCGVWVTDRAMYTYGSTPIKNSLNDTQQYFEQDVFDRADQLKDCRQNFLILLTDGLETCSNTNTTCVAATDLGKRKIPVFVIGYGLGTSGNALDCIAKNSGGQLYLPNNLEELIAALRSIGQEIQERLAAFSAPAVPSVELTTREKGYISTFFSVAKRSIWEGHLRAYLVDENTGLVPVSCQADDAGQELCFPDTSKKLWDAGDELADMDVADRRIYFGANGPGGAVPGSRDVFTVSSSTEATLYGRIFGVAPSFPMTATERSELSDVVSFIRGVREAVSYRYPYDPDDETPTGLVARLGDVFHSVPAISGRPDCFPCYQRNINNYRQFYEDNQWRRKVLFAGADDGMMHAVDAGFYARNTARADEYDDGTGVELFGWIPNAVMGTLDVLATTDDHQYTVDGPPTVADVFIDTSNSSASPPSAADRQWRTVLLHGQRSGGRSVVALDVNQPDYFTVSPTGVKMPVSGAGGLPSCAGGACGAPYPNLLWEFSDGDGADADANPDLADTWSRPAVGIVKVRASAGADPEDRYVAVFGGGYFRAYPAMPANEIGGQYLYMVDIETGKVLLKVASPAARSTPGEVGLLDSDFNGAIERVYWTDTGGSIWRLDTTGVATLNSGGQVSCVFNDPNNGNCSTWTVQRLFTESATYQPIFHRPLIVLAGFDGTGNAIYAIGAGSGDRERIVKRDPAPHAFALMLDPGPGSAQLPYTRANLHHIGRDDAAVASSTNYLSVGGISDPGQVKGWYLELGAGEKVNTPAIALASRVIFATFTPSEEWEYRLDEDTGTMTCWKRGDAKTYVVDFLNANPAPRENAPDGTPVVPGERYMQLRGDVLMVSEPIVYVGEDGKLHVLQATDNLAITQPVAPTALRGSIVSWREVIED